MKRKVTVICPGCDSTERFDFRPGTGQELDLWQCPACGWLGPQPEPFEPGGVDYNWLSEQVGAWCNGDRQRAAEALVGVPRSWVVRFCAMLHEREGWKGLNTLAHMLERQSW